MKQTSYLNKGISEVPVLTYKNIKLHPETRFGDMLTDLNVRILASFSHQILFESICYLNMGKSETPVFGILKTTTYIPKLVSTSLFSDRNVRILPGFYHTVLV